MKLIISILFTTSLILGFSSTAKADSYFIVQGLGNKFSVMNDIIEELKSRGHKIFEMHLKGHDKNDYEELKTITAQKWTDQFLSVYSQIPRGDKKHFVGYSLGASVGISTISKYDFINFDSAVLFAPSIAIQSYINIIKLLDKLGIPGLPSLGPTDNRAHSFIPMQTYRALFKAEFNAQKVNSAKLNKMKTTIFMDSWDFFVSYSRIEKWIESNQLKSWKLVDIDASVFGARHMVMQKSYVSKKSWDIILKSL